MPIKRLTPLRPALSSAEVRSHLRQIDAHEAGLIDGYVLASQQDIEIQCERAITAAQFRLTLPGFPPGSITRLVSQPFEESHYDGYSSRTGAYTDGSGILLKMCPVVAITSIAYYDVDNAAQTYSTYNLFTDDEPGVVRQSLGTFWPNTYSRGDAVTITFWAGSLIPLTVNVATDTFTSVTGYPFADDDPVIISKSGNSNSVIGDVASVPDGITENTTYYVVSSTGTTFQIAATVGGAAVSLGNPSASGQSIDLLFAGQIEPYHRLALLQMTSKAFGERCPQGGCVCSADEFESYPMLRRLKWRSPVEFVG